MIRLTIAVAGLVGFTLGPFAYQLSVRNEDPADFGTLTQKLDSIAICPPDWRVTEGEYEFSEDWRRRLDLHHHRNAQIVTDSGRRMDVLLMLSATGEQLYHTPDICYAAQGCKIRGEVVSLPLKEPQDSNIRVVSVGFPQTVGEAVRTAAFGYWVDSQWYSPPQSNILNRMGREPFLLKVQVLMDDAVTSDPRARSELDEYLAFLGQQLRSQQFDAT